MLLLSSNSLKHTTSTKVIHHTLRSLPRLPVSAYLSAYARSWYQSTALQPVPARTLPDAAVRSHIIAQTRHSAFRTPTAIPQFAHQPPHETLRSRYLMLAASTL